MSKAVTCPVCFGTGKWRKAIVDSEETCHGCGGRGWVEVADDLTPFTPYIPPYSPPYYPPYDPYPTYIPPIYHWNPVTTWCHMMEDNND